MTRKLSVDSIADLRKRKSTKWREYDSDVLPLPVAEMDYPIAEPIAVERTTRTDIKEWAELLDLDMTSEGGMLKRYNLTSEIVKSKGNET